MTMAAPRSKRAAAPAEPGTLEEDEDAVAIKPGQEVDAQVGHRWDNRRRPKRGPHIAAHPTMVPTDEAELARCLMDPEWRLFSGCLYQIIVKGESDDDDSFVMPFKPNRAQRRFIMRLWNRNLILKARQLGFTTLIALMWLDHALFNGNQRCGMIAQDRETAEAIFRDKVVFAYDHLPEEIRQRFPLARASTKELLFAHNNSSLRVATSVRGGTIHRLHVSEFGKICAKFPHKAVEVVTGSFQAVPLSGIIVVESTAEGQDGEFYRMCQRAMALVTGAGRLTASQYRFHFYAWWQDPAYRMDPAGVVVSQELQDYFDEIESLMGCTIDTGQRAWYVEKLNNDFAGAEDQMWREYPSTPQEAFQQSTKGNYYAKELMLVRKRGGITTVPMLDLPVFTFWDIGSSDGTAIWFMQCSRMQDRFIGYYEEHDEDLRHYATELQRRGFVYGGHFLPHDADHKRLGDYNKSVKEQLQGLLPGHKFFIVPRVTELMTGILTTRKHFKSAWFDLEGTKKGVERLAHYKKKWSQADARYLDSTPDKSNGCSEGADAFRQWAQAKELGLLELMSDQGGYVEAPVPSYY
ncbi:terminase [Paracidovorax citrulli]|uniref:Terminase n=2 Tax=Paracidovorax citrulli TaxID=80869 RepID=A0ABY9AKB2_PARCI|nr:terminase [Paracidovorax citrulli]UEG44871.1 terminase [Paracidovorax citrulli]WIY33333.1 terminase [Paracidovorax citrulli]WIY47376.1 terminase [Paracidovorax citrulli]